MVEYNDRVLIHNSSNSKTYSIKVYNIVNTYTYKLSIPGFSLCQNIIFKNIIPDGLII